MEQRPHSDSNNENSSRGQNNSNSAPVTANNTATNSNTSSSNGFLPQAYHLHHSNVPSYNYQNQTIYPDPLMTSTIPSMIAAKPPTASNSNNSRSSSYQQPFPSSPSTLHHHRHNHHNLNGVPTTVIPTNSYVNSTSSKVSDQNNVTTSSSITSFASSNEPQIPSSISSMSYTGNHTTNKTGFQHHPPPSASAAPTTTTLGGVSIPALSPNISTAMQVQVAAAAAAAAAAPPRISSKSTNKRDSTSNNNNKNSADDGANGGPPNKRGKRASSNTDLTRAEKQKLNRDRNRDHARATRLRKKAYVNKLKELVEGLHAERSEEARKRRVAVQHLAEVQTVRRNVIRSFLQYHSSYEPDHRKWATLLEDNFFLKQPITPFRSFRRIEIEQECRKTCGLDSVIADAASMAVMIESIGHRSSRWMHIKREDFCAREDCKSSSIRNHMPRSIVRQNSRLQHAVSSLSSSSGSSNGNGSGEEEERNQKKRQQQQQQQQQIIEQQAGITTTKESSAIETKNPEAKKLSSSSSGSGSNTSNINTNNTSQQNNNDFHDYHAQPLPDPMLDSGHSSASAGSDSVTSDHAVAGIRGKHVCTDSSSSDDEDKITRQKKSTSARRENGTKNDNHFKANNIVDVGKKSNHRHHHKNHKATSTTQNITSKLPPNIAQRGGITHTVGIGMIHHQNDNVVNERLNSAPAVPLPPFVGIGKRALPGDSRKMSISKTHNSSGESASMPSDTREAARNSTNDGVVQHPALIPSSKDTLSGSANGATIIAADNDTASSESSYRAPQIQASYHINEDDMLLTDDILMCPFIFRSQDAVICGALAECIMPGMLRAHFSQRNKLYNVEMIYDAMGFMQQLERASGSEGGAQIIPNSLDMALQPSTCEARAITLAKPPFRIVSVNEPWTRTTKYSQMEVEGNSLNILHGKRTDPEAGKRAGKPVHDFHENAKGICACSVNVYYDKHGRDFVAFVSSYPLTNANDEVTHLLHVWKKLTVPATPEVEYPDGPSNSSVSFQLQ